MTLLGFNDLTECMSVGDILRIHGQLWRVLHVVPEAADLIFAGPITPETDAYGADECDNDFGPDEDYCVDDQVSEDDEPC